MERGLFIVSLSCVAGFAGCVRVDANDSSRCGGDEPSCSGGEFLTTTNLSDRAFEQRAAGLDSSEREVFRAGHEVFDRPWTPIGVGPEDFDGLGPLFNAFSCQECHRRNGRLGPFDTAREDGVSPALLFRLGDATGAPDPVYGGQFNPVGTRDVDGEGRARVTWERVNGAFADGTPYELLAPTFSLDGTYGDFASDVHVSPRATPPVFGLGLFDAVTDETLLALEDPEDRDRDGISGRIHWVVNPSSGVSAPGKMGWKAEQPDVRSQNAAAFAGDLGIASSLFAEQPCTTNQSGCLAQAENVEELTDQQLDEVTFFIRHLAVPARRPGDEQLLRLGEQIFAEVGCASCHTPSMETGWVTGNERLDGQKIQAYTDLLLHDMGAGLADDGEHELASEWRTPPLWGIGLTEMVNGHMRLLHDGRARSLTEAILWHGGEAEQSKEAYRELESGERFALEEFLWSL